MDLLQVLIQLRELTLICKVYILIYINDKNNYNKYLFIFFRTLTRSVKNSVNDVRVDNVNLFSNT